MSEVQTLARGLRILDLMASGGDSVGVTELSKKLNVDKGSISRMLQTLVKYRFAERDPRTRRYRLGPRIGELHQQMERYTQLKRGRER